MRMIRDHVGLLEEIPLVGQYYYNILVKYLEQYSYTMTNNDEYHSQFITTSAEWNMYILYRVDTDKQINYRIRISVNNYKTFKQVRIHLERYLERVTIFSNVLAVEGSTVYKRVNFMQFLPELYEIFQAIELSNPLLEIYE